MLSSPTPIVPTLSTLSPTDFDTNRKTGAVMSALLNQCQANDAAAALIPWFCDRLPSPKSRKDYHDAMRKFFLHLQAQGIHPYDVTGDHLRLYKEALSATKSAATIAQALSVIRGVYEQFGKKGLVPWPFVSDIQAVAAPKVNKNTTPSLDEANAIRLLHAPNTSTMIGCRDHAMLFTYFITLYRSSAVARATIGNLEFTNPDWYLHATEKRNNKRRLPLLTATKSVLHWIEFSGRSLDDVDAPLFPAIGPDKRTVTDRHLTTRAILNVVKKYARQIGLDPSPRGRRGIGTHTLRKTGGNNAHDNGATIKQLQSLFGHADIRTTQSYIVYTEQDAEEAARRIHIR